MMEQAAKTADTGTRVVTIVNFTALAAMPARYALERADWRAAAALPITKTDFPAADSLTRFARGLGMVRSGDVAGAKHEVDAIHELRGALQKSNQSYWADRSQDQILAVSGWIAHAEGSRDEAVKLMRAAADREDASVKHVAMENRLYPMRELLAELLRDMDQGTAALREYEAALKENPNRYRGIYGAARAAQASGNLQKANEYFAKLVAQSKNADTERPELGEAKTFLAKK
jgi:tetratricopeptide (TPR) repeat protein